MKFSKENIPDIVKLDEVYSEDGIVWNGSSGEIKSPAKVLSTKEVHDFAKVVISFNKTSVLKHLLANGFNFHLGDMIFFACQHGAMDMTRLILDLRVRSKENNILSNKFILHSFTGRV